MADENTPDDELDPDEQGDGEGEGESEGEGEDTRTREELLAENAELTRRLNRSRTAKAREARAANRSKDKGGDGGSKEEPNPLADENAELKAKLAEQEARSNRTQAQAIAAELGFRKPAYGVKLLDWDDLDDPSDPDEVRAALREVLKDDPALKKAAKSADGGEGGSGSAAVGRSFNDIIRSAAGRS